MLTSELLTIIQTSIKENGDIPVVLDDADTNYIFRMEKHNVLFDDELEALVLTVDYGDEFFSR